MGAPPPPEPGERSLPRWLSGCLITLAVLIVLIGLCIAIVPRALEGAVLIAPWL